jgi:hypothetical protein
MKKLLLLTLGLSLGLLAAQSPILPRAHSPLQYRFRLSEAQVQQVLTKGLDALSHQDLPAPIDSLHQTETFHSERWPYGYYLLSQAAGNQEQRELVSVYRWQAYVVNNERELMLAVYDSSGQAITTATVALDGKAIPFDAVSQTYRLAKRRREGLLRITHQGYRDYYHIEARRGKITLSGIGLRIAWTPPVRWLWRPPYRLVADVVRSFQRYQPYGWVNRVVKPFTHDYWDQRRRDRHRGYLALDKPKHRPGDTVRIKAVLMTRHGKPYANPLGLYLRKNDGKQVRLAELSPYRPGAYRFTWLPHDSLALRQGSRYTLSLRDHHGTTLLMHPFYYQDYELSGTKASFRVSENSHHRGQPSTLSARLFDENNLNLPGARVKLTLRSSSSPEQFAPRVFVPKVLWTHEQALDPIGETEIVLPDSIFPAADLAYELQAELLSADGEREVQVEQMHAVYDRCWLKLEERGDSLYGQVSGCANGPVQAELVTVFSGGEVFHQTLSLPFARAISPQATAYQLTQGARRADFAPARDQVQTAARRTVDSLFVRIANPQSLPLWYELFRGKTRSVARGQVASLDLAMAAHSRQPYFLSVSYLWRGQIQKKEYRLDLEPHRLQVDFEAHENLYPGQTTELALRVQDYRGQPVADADVLAFAYTSKFDQQATPYIPSVAHQVKQRRSYNSFSVDRSKAQGPTELDYQHWRGRYGLDSLQAYQFLYPDERLFRYLTVAPDSFTQLAAYVMDSGAIEPVLISYVDAQPHYLDVALNQAGYTQPIDSGWHSLRLRTQTHVIRIDSVYVPQGHLLLLSVDQDQFPQSDEQLEPMITRAEARNLGRYLMPVQVFDLPYYAYVQQGQRTFPLYHDHQSRRQSFAGT